MKFNPFQAVFLTFLACTAFAAQAEPTPHSSTERWVVNYADNQCVASLNFGDDKHPLILALKPSPAGDIMQLVVVKQAGFFDSPAQVPVKVRFDDQPAREFSMLAVQGNKAGPDNFRINLSLADFAPMRSASSVTITSRGKMDEKFQLVQMTPLMRTIDNCVADLRRHWNIDSDLQSKLRSRAKNGDLPALFSSDDYPGVSLQERQGGLVGLVILIDEKGKPADCMVTQTSNSAALDTQACAMIMKRAKYDPAIGDDGKPAKSADTAKIRWEIPGG
jgi:TonB family protein